MLSNRLTYTFVFILLAIHSGLLAYSATLHSPTLNEPGHLVAGLTHWKFGRFEVYRVNPPLTHYVAAIPVMMAGYKEDWSGFFDAPGVRPEFRMGADFIKANGERSIWLFTLARWAMIPFSLTGALFCFAWSRELWGSNLAGLISLWFWCFEPFLLGHAELITPDVPATSLGLGATYLFWKWLNTPTWVSAALAGIFLGFAELTKTSWIILFGIWPLLLAFRLIVENKTAVNSAPFLSPQALLTRTTQLATILLIGVYLLNLFYGFEGSFTKLKDFQFVSKSLTGLEKSGEVGNRFMNSWLGEVPMPVPKQYLSGIDLQKKDFEDYGQPSYLRGEWRNGGWWYYYLYGLAVKTTHGLQAALVLAVFTIHWQLRSRTPEPLADRNEGTCINKVSQNKSWRMRDLVILLAPALLLMVMVSSQLEFNHHVRYVMPVLGHCFVLLGVLAAWWSVATAKARVRLSVMSLSVLAALSVSVSLTLGLPHQLAYFNALSGGVRNGYRHLLHSNVDWNQDLLLLKEWLDSHPHARPVLLEGSNMYQPEHLGLDVASRGERIELREQPHLLAASVNYLQKEGLLRPVTGETRSLRRDAIGEHLLGALEMARIGTTLRVYRLDGAAASNTEPQL